MDILKNFVEQAKKKNGTVVFPEGDEERTIEAAVRLARDGICRAHVLAPRREMIEETARKKMVDLSHVTVIEPDRSLLDGKVVTEFVRRRVEKGMAQEAAEGLVGEPLHFGALYVASGRAHAAVAGARSDTADVLRAALHGIGTARGVKLISSYFIMVPPEGHPLVQYPLVYADCAVNPDPGARGLRDIATASITSFKRLFPSETVRLAFLSFSTKGSAEHVSLAKVREAAAKVKEEYAADPLVRVDGELQFDAAVVPVIARKKAPGSTVEGRANILIFPDLNAGNIGYKLTERFANFAAIGPVIQGLAKPFSDLSRGCSVDDIYYVSAITLLQA